MLVDDANAARQLRVPCEVEDRIVAGMMTLVDWPLTPGISQV